VVQPRFANINPAREYEGTVYAAGVPLTAAEADVWGGTGAAELDPIAIPYNQNISASVLFTATGPIKTSTAYIVLQTDWNDNNWVDLAWCIWTGTSGTALFALCAGAETCNSFQQTRVAGNAPQSNGSNAFPLAGRLRFVGAAAETATSLSSSSSGQPGPQVQVSIRYKLLGLR
jgi:hypothetical protein